MDFYFINRPILTLLLCLVIISATCFVHLTFKYYKRLPPGPWGFPVVGYLPWLNKKPHHHAYVELARKYGDIISLKLGRNLVVCLGSVKLIKELFNRADSTGRPHTPLIDLLKGRGIVQSEGELWTQQRQFLSEKFRELGVKMRAQADFEKFLLFEVQDLIENLQKIQGQPINPSVALGRHVHNAICQLMMSFRFESENEEFTNFNTKVSEGMRLYGSVHIGEHVPLYLGLPGKSIVIKKIIENLKQICSFHGNHLVNRRSERSDRRQGEKSADLLDCYLDAIDKTTDYSKTFPGCNTRLEAEGQVVQVMNDLFSAGMETSRTTLVWALLIMLREPEVAAKVKAALAEVVAPGTLVTLDHYQQLVYVEGVLYETLRRAAVVPLGTTHVNDIDWEINTYYVPAGSHIVPLINKIHMDPTLFPDPEKFIPERFIHNGKLVIAEGFMPYGIGRRRCLGENLARMELFLFFANIMNNFDFELAEGHSLPGLEGTLGITHAPLPFELCFRQRIVDK